MTDHDPRVYLTARLDQLTAANAAADSADDSAAADALAQLIRDDHPDARAAVADALRLAAARDQAGSDRDTA